MKVVEKGAEEVDAGGVEGPGHVEVAGEGEAEAGAG